jgi:hypothetical protein
MLADASISSALEAAALVSNQHISLSRAQEQLAKV